MTSLTLFNKDNIELVIREDGECFYPGYRALARVCSIGLGKVIHDVQVKRTIESVLKGATDFVLENAEVLTSGGLQGATLIPRKLGTQVIKKYNSALYEEMADAGHLVFLHQLVGYKIVSQPPQPESQDLTKIQARLTFLESEIATCERCLERIKIKDSWIRLTHVIEDWAVKNPEAFSTKKVGLSLYLAGICNGLYQIMWGMTKKTICEKYEIPYHDEEIIRDFIPENDLKLLSTIEETVIELVQVQTEPDKAIQDAAKMVAYRFGRQYKVETKKNSKREKIRYGLPFVKMEHKPEYLPQHIGNLKRPELEDYLTKLKTEQIGCNYVISMNQPSLHQLASNY